jgi:hypothetical protein
METHPRLKYSPQAAVKRSNESKKVIKGSARNDQGMAGSLNFLPNERFRSNAR